MIPGTVAPQGTSPAGEKTMALRALARRSVVAGLVLAVLLPLAAACTGGGPGGRGDGAYAALSPELTAQALASADPAQRRRGAWSVLANLGVAVYRPGGEPVLAGVRPGPDGVHVVESQVDVLADMAGTAREPMAAFAQRLVRAGVDSTPAELLALYRSAYAGRPDGWLVRLLREREVDFAGDGEFGPALDALSEWLLLLDAFAAPGGGPSAPAAPGAVASRAAPAAPGWGVAYAAGGRDLTPAGSPGESYAQAVLLWQGVRLRMSPQAARLAQGTGGHGDAVDVVATVDASHATAAATAFGRAPLLVAANPLPEKVSVRWQPPVELVGHLDVQGLTVSGPVHWSDTDAAGRATVRLSARQDPGGPGDPQRSATGVLRAAPVDDGRLLRAVFPAVPEHLAGLLAGMPRPDGLLPVTVSWHQQDDCDTFTDGEWTGTAEVSGTVTVPGGKLTAAGGRLTFRLVVVGGNVVDGEVRQFTELAGAVGGREAVGVLEGDGRPAGKGAEVTFGYAEAIVDLSVGGGELARLPIPSGGRGRLVPREGDCRTLTGELFTPLPGAARAGGVAGALSARFTATRTG